MFNSHTKFEMSMIGVTRRVHLWLDGKRIVNFLLVIIKFFR